MLNRNPQVIRLLTILASAAVLTTCAVAQKPRSQGLVVDFLSGATYYEATDGSLVPAGIHPVIRSGSPLQVKVINVNTFKYAVTVNSEETESFSKQPAALDSFFVGTLADPAGAGRDLNSVANTFKSGKGATATTLDTRAWDAAAAALKDSVDELSGYITDTEKLSDLIPELQQLVVSAPDPKLEDETPNDPRAASRKILLAIRDKVMARVSDVLSEIESDTNSSGMLLKEGENPDFPSLGRFLRRGIALRAAKMNTVYREFSAQSQILSYALGNSTDAGARSLQPDFERSRADADAVVESVKLHLATADQHQKEVSEALEQLNQFYGKVVNEDFFMKEDHPFTPRADSVKINIRVVPLAPVASLATLQQQTDPPQPIIVEVNVIGKTKIDYSTGLFFTNLTDTKVNLVDVGGQTVISRGASDNFRPGFAALMHVYQTSNKRFIPAVSLGLSFDGTEPSYLLGATLLTGRESRLAFTIGFAGRKVDRLNGVHVGDPTSLEPGQLTTKVFRTGLFLGLTFNLRS